MINKKCKAYLGKEERCRETARNQISGGEVEINKGGGWAGLAQYNHRDRKVVAIL